MNEMPFDREALEFASRHYEIPLDEPGAEAILRGSAMFAWHRLGLAICQLGRDIHGGLPGALRRLLGDETGDGPRPVGGD